MPVGKIKKIVQDRGFGFIVPEQGGGDLFFHVSGLEGVAIEELSLDDRVAYDVDDEDRKGKGPRAVNVRRA